MFCEYCGNEFNLIKKFLIHLEYVHIVQNNCMCSYKTCLRSFHRKDAFRAHLKQNIYQTLLQILLVLKALFTLKTKENSIKETKPLKPEVHPFDVFWLVESFSANYFCRFCNSKKEDTQKQIYVAPDLHKLVSEYDAHVASKMFGEKEKCIWHDLENFHIYDNMVCDIMHDLFEGVHRYDIALIIWSLIRHKFFTLNTLNSRIKYLSYHTFETNKPPYIKSDHLINGSVICSASEMLCCKLQNFHQVKLCTRAN